MRRIACLWLPDWPLQRLVVKRPEMANAPIVLQALDARQESRVVFCSSQARALGIRPGMPLMEARSLMEHSRRGHATLHRKRTAPAARSQPPWYIEPHESEADQLALLQLAQWCEQFSPLVGWEPQFAAASSRQRSTRTGPHSNTAHSTSSRNPNAGSPGTAEIRGNRQPGFDGTIFLDATSVAALFGGEQAMGKKIVSDLTARGYGQPGYGMRLAIADSIGAAWGVAHYAESLRSRADETLFEKSLAAADRSQAGYFETLGDSLFWCVLSGEAGRGWLAQLPVAALRLPSEVLGKLEQLGVQTIEQLERLGRSQLASRLGDIVPLRLGQFWSTILEPIEVHHAEPSFEAQRWLEQPLAGREPLTEIIRRLLVELTDQLRAQGRGALKLECQLDQTHFHVGLYEPSACAHYLWQLLEVPWERLRLPGPIAWLAVRAPLTVCTTHRQQELFASSLSGQVGREWTVLIERLSSRLGKDQVSRAELLNGAEPERAYRYVAWLDRSRRTAVEPAAHRPLQLLATLLPLEEVELAPDDTPRAFRCRQTRHEIHRCWGPERIVTSWWRQRTVARDYYQVETTTGARLWICQQHANRAWFLHGVF